MSRTGPPDRPRHDPAGRQPRRRPAARPSSLGGLAAPAAHAANVVTPGQLHRLRLRPVPRPRARRDGPLAQALAVPRRGHLHLRQLPRLPQPAEPDPHVGQHPAAQGLAPAADHARPAGVLPAALPALRRRHDDQPHARRPTASTRRARARAAPRPTRPSPPPQRAGHRAGQHALVRPRGLRPTPSPTAASPRWRSSARGPASCTRSATSSGVYSSAGSGIEMLDDARVNRPGQFSPARPDLDRPLGRRRQHVHVVHPRGRLAPGGRVKQYQGGHDETWGGVRSTSTATTSTSASAPGRRPRRTATGSPSASAIPRRCGPPPRTGADPAQVTALQCLLKEKGLYAGTAQRHATTRRPRRPPTRGRTGHGFSVRRAGADRTGCRC